MANSDLERRIVDGQLWRDFCDEPTVFWPDSNGLPVRLKTNPLTILRPKYYLPIRS